MNPNILVSIRLKSIEKEELKALKAYTGLSYADLSNRIESDEPISLIQLKSVNFYSGVKELLILLKSFKSDYKLLNENEEIKFQDLQAISDRKVRLSDFR